MNLFDGGALTAFRVRRADGSALWTGGSLRGADGKVQIDRKSTRLNSSHLVISYAVFCLKKKNTDDLIGLPVVTHLPYIDSLTFQALQVRHPLRHCLQILNYIVHNLLIIITPFY